MHAEARVVARREGVLEEAVARGVVQVDRKGERARGAVLAAAETGEEGVDGIGRRGVLVASQGLRRVEVLDSAVEEALHGLRRDTRRGVHEHGKEGTPSSLHAQ